MIISNLPKPYSLVLLVISSMVVAACNNSDADKAAKRSDKAATAHVVATRVAQMQTVQNRLTISGTIEAGTIVRLYNEVSGKIRYLPYHEGDKLVAGTVVIGLDDQIIQAELDKATASREQASIDYQRLQKLQKQLASDDEIARARTAYNIAVADEQLQKTRLEKTTIEAPFDGVIAERLFEPGDVVPMHSHVLTLIDPESLQVTVYLAENWIPRIQPGDPVEIQIDALSSSVHPGLIKRVHPTIDANTRKGAVEIEFRPIPFGARAGQLARVHLKTRASERLVVPAHALHHDAKGAYVYVVGEENTARKTYVQKGTQFGNSIEISTGIEVNDAVVVKGFNGLRHGKKVRVRNDGRDEASRPS